MTKTARRLKKIELDRFRLKLFSFYLPLRFCLHKFVEKLKKTHLRTFDRETLF